MSVSQWEVVTKSSKNKGDGRNKISKGQKKLLREKMPKLEEMPPIQESQTIFEAFLEQERKREHPNTKANGKIEPLNKKSLGQQKKKSQEKKKSQTSSKQLSFDDVINELSTEDFESLLATSQTRFPDNPNIWLKDLASYLNGKLQFETPDPVFTDKPVGYPTSSFQPALHTLLLNTLNQCTPQTLQLFFEYCLVHLVQDMLKGLPVHGYRIFLQCLAELKPEIIVTNLPRFCDLRTSYQNRQNVCLSLLWAAGQAGIYSLKSGLKVWLELMMPVLGMRAYSKYIVDYLESLISLHPNVVSESGVLGVRELFSILDIVYTPSGLPGALQKQMQTLYPKLKVLSYGPNHKALLQNYFPSYLGRLQPSCSPALKQELFSCLVECLLLDRQCYSLWRQLYTKHLIQSSLLMSHLLEHWGNLPSSFPVKLLKETLSTFRVTNDELQSQYKTNQDGYEDCVKYCNELLTRMTDWKFPWRNLVLIFLISFSVLLVYDVHVHGSFKSSKTRQILKENGLLSVCEQAYGRISFYSGKVYKWLEVNIPVYYAYLCKVCGPYLQLFWEKLFVLCIYIWNKTSGLREWFCLSVPPLLHWLNDHLPHYIEMAVLSTIEACKILQKFIVWMWSYIAFYITVIGVWLQQNVFIGSLSPENLQRYAGYTVDVFQKYTISAYHWVSHQISAVVSSNK